MVRGIGQESVIFINKNILLTTLTRLSLSSLCSEIHMRLRLSIPLTRYQQQRPEHFRVRAGWLVRVRGIEPPTTAWKAVVLPLNYTRK